MLLRAASEPIIIGPGSEHTLPSVLVRVVEQAVLSGQIQTMLKLPINQRKAKQVEIGQEQTVIATIQHPKTDIKTACYLHDAVDQALNCTAL